jgi:hypothetical protein
MKSTNTSWGSEENQKLLKRIAERLREIGEKTPTVIKILANHGWYIPFDSIPEEIFGYAEALEAGEVDLVNNEMRDIFEKNMNNIISRACKSFPNRTVMLMEAKLAHENKMYFASTSLFLSNADGILKGRLYKPDAFKRESNDRGIRINEFTKFLTEQNSISRPFSPDNNNGQANYLNRHGVLHGTDVSYGTKMNSLKALSLLDYVATFVLP